MVSRGVCWCCLLLVVQTWISLVEGQFPTVCMENATLPLAVCCPTPAGSSEVCGGRARGSCERINVPDQTSSARWSKLPLAILQDDRLHWPLRFFTFACECKGNFAGSACERCKPGFTGPTCTVRRPKRIRRNILKMTPAEQRLHRDVMDASKYKSLDWSVISVSGPETSDPITKDKLHYTNASVYDFLVHWHYYAARSSMLNNGMTSCNSGLHVLDYAHRGPVFLPWHRYYLILFEELLADIALEQYGVQDYALPYWDWTGAEDCIICTDDLIGDIYNPNVTVSTPRTLDDLQRLRTTPNTSLSPLSPFSRWKAMCGNNDSRTDPCFYCDLSDNNTRLFNRWLNDGPDFARFASQEDMDYVMSLRSYEEPPYDMSAPNTSFRNSLEGFARVGDHPLYYATHNLAHNFLQGTGHDRTTSPNDPFFYYHHVFIDKVFEVWLQIRNETEKKYPTNADELRYGHHPDDFMVPTFPPLRVADYYVDAEDLGYGYDDNKIGSSVYEPAERRRSNLQLRASLNPTGREDVSEGHLVLILAIVVSLLVLGIAALAIYKFKTIWQRKQYSLANGDEMLKQRKTGKNWLFKMPFHSASEDIESSPLLE